MRQGSSINTGCIITMNSVGITHIFKIKCLRGEITFLSHKLDSSFKYNQHQLNAFLDAAKLIGSKKCDFTSDQPKMYLTMNDNKSSKASFYYSCYRVRRDTEFGKFIERCLSFSYD